MNPSFHRVAPALAAAMLLAGCPSGAEPPRLQLSPASITFPETMAGTDDFSLDEFLWVINAGGGSLAPLRVSVDYGEGPGGWLAVTAESPVALRVHPSTAFAPGSYDATIRVATPGAVDSPASVDVHLTLTANPDPVIGTSVAQLGFVALRGGADPTPQRFTVSNVGGGTLGAPTLYAHGYVLDASGAVDPAWAETNWLSAVLSGEEVTVTASAAGLPRGHHRGWVGVQVAGAYEPYVSVLVELDVTDAVQQVGPASLAFTMVGGETPEPQILVVADVGDGSLAPPAAVTSDGWFVAEVMGEVPPYLVRVSIAPFVSTAGTYAGTVTIDSGNATNDPLLVPVTLVVQPTPPVTVSCYLPDDAVCQEFASTNASARTSFAQACGANGGAMAACPAGNRVGACADVYGLTTDAARYRYVFYAPGVTVESGQSRCAALGGVWASP